MDKGIKPVVWVRSVEALASHCDEWMTLPMVSMDTEFIRTNTFFPTPALIQLHDGKANYLIDPLAIDDLSALSRLMQASEVIKAMHACSEDLEVFFHLHGALPENVLDTQVAAAMCSYGYSVGYANLAQQMLSITIPKEETRSDWLKRPLTDAQQAYAALDVEYLFLIARRLLDQLQQQGRLSWVNDDYTTLCERFMASQQPACAIDRLKAAWRLQGRQLAILHRLAAWREGVARSRNIPRSWVVPDSALYNIAERAPDHIGQLHAIEGLSASAIRRHGDAMVDEVKQALTLADEALPPTQPQPLNSEQRKIAKKLRNCVGALADEQGIAPELIARRGDYEYMARALHQGLSGPAILPGTMTGWRAKMVASVIPENK